MKPQDYNYRLPPELIAHTPVEPRDSARLMIYSTSTNEILIDTFAHISRYLPSESLLVLNDTKVVPARLELMKLTGGTVRILFLLNEWDKSNIIKGLPDRKLTVGDMLFFNHKALLEIIDQKNEEFTFRLHVPTGEFEKITNLHGQTPLPPYIQNTTLSEDQVKNRYQTIFANQPSSVAAPTASLHFTEQVFQSLASKGIERVPVTLHVGRGTFSPLNAKNIEEHKLHKEPIQISQESAGKIMNKKQSGKMIIASGTTAVRTLESASEHILKGEGYVGETELMIAPPFEFKIVDVLVTNFHLPNTSLIMLVDAFLQSKKSKKTWRDLYERAISEKMRFYSFGDALLII